ncbi:MAG TPA: hypothetical protein QF624_02415 [Dehalococcoidia bacterium]|nr:hypothetical protein [Dehalococcoidia bacterium]
MKRLTRLTAMVAGSAYALVPALAIAQEHDRSLEAAGEFWSVAFYAALGAGALLLLSSIAYLYRHERGLNWDFQKPDADDHGESHD